MMSAVPVLHAQGFGLNEIGTCAVARGQAATGAPCTDPSVIYWNPAALISLQHWSIYAGAAAIGVRGRFIADTTRHSYALDAPADVPPHLFLSYGGHRWAAGLGAYVPYGLSIGWPSDFPGRFAAQRAQLTSIYVQPTIAIQLTPGNWSVGGGPVFGRSSAELVEAVDLATVPVPFSVAGLPPGVSFGALGIRPGTAFARARLKGSATAWGFNVGIHGHITPVLQVGARYLSAMRFRYEDARATFGQISTGLIIPAAIPTPLGTLPAGTQLDALLASEFAPGGALVPQRVTTTIENPAQLAVGVGYSGLRHARLSVDYVWFGWSVFDRLPLNFQGPAAAESRTIEEQYHDSWALRSGGEYRLANGWVARAGFSYAPSPVPDQSVAPLLPDMNRYNISAGIGVPIGGRYTMDAAYLHVGTTGRRGRIADRRLVPPNALVLTSIPPAAGFYELSADVVSLSVRARF
ncbi:MAG TPA: outer membrane protein transport protein [Gemmatimonadaceae bacterium]|nr:outer membrane protein transport protein [Gemmatimonadaceae bacterium]